MCEIAVSTALDPRQPWLAIEAGAGTPSTNVVRPDVTSSGLSRAYDYRECSTEATAVGAASEMSS